MRISKVRASPVAQMVKNPSIIRETWVPSLGGEDSLEDGVSPHFSILAWRVPMDRGTWWATHCAQHIRGEILWVTTCLPPFFPASFPEVLCS